METRVAREVMSHPASVTVHVRRVWVAIHIAHLVLMFDALRRRVMSGRTVRGNIASSYVNVTLFVASISILRITVGQETER
jgi:hypothetical protein